MDFDPDARTDDELNAVFEVVADPTRSAKSGSDVIRSTAAPLASNAESSVTRRYQDAYLVARVTTRFGAIIKGIGISIAVIIVLGVVSQVNSSSSQLYGDAKTVYAVSGCILASVIGAVFYLFGVLVSAQGQILMASLDCAVNGSPFLTNDQKARTMSL